MARNKFIYLPMALVLLTLLYAFQNCSPMGKAANGYGVQLSQGAPGGGGPTLYSPSVAAGNDQAISTSTANLVATASDVDGVIASVQWIQISGPSTATLTGATTLTPAVGNLINGTYVFRVSVTDNDNLSKADDVTIVVSGIVTPLTATFASISSKILAPKCVSCHGAVAPAKGVNLSTYAGTTAAAVLTKGNANVSKLYTEVSSGCMPSAAAMLSSTEITTLRDWINAGALNI
jgi:hypothetical protein